MTLQDSIAQGLQALGYSEQQLERLQQTIHAYLLLIKKWNGVHNLTAIRQPEEMVSQHIMDSLAVVPYIHGPHIVDVGTGAGLPGIPIALARPDWQITLIESNKKKTSFLQQAKIELGLTNVDIVSERIEDFYPKERVDAVISRAFSSLGEFIQLSGHLNVSNEAQCKWVAMKSNCTDQELAQIKLPYCIENIVELIVPRLAAKRQLVVIHQKVC